MLARAERDMLPGGLVRASARPERCARAQPRVTEGNSARLGACGRDGGACRRTKGRERGRSIVESHALRNAGACQDRRPSGSAIAWCAYSRSALSRDARQATAHGEPCPGRNIPRPAIM